MNLKELSLPRGFGLYTVGHGRRSVDELAELLAAPGVASLVDVRRFPVSRRNPHLGRSSLEAELPRRGLAYQWWGETLGGRRHPRPGPSRHPGWEQGSFRAYADHMDSPEFRCALLRLMEVAADRPTAVMCAETLWWRCHRRLIADAVLLRGTSVVHLLSPGHRDEHRVPAFARTDDDGWPVYDLGVQAPPL